MMYMAYYSRFSNHEVSTSVDAPGADAARFTQAFSMFSLSCCSNVGSKIMKNKSIKLTEMYFVNKINLIIYGYENATNSSSLLWYALVFHKKLDDIL